jgi:hypothetical protein
MSDVTCTFGIFAHSHPGEEQKWDTGVDTRIEEMQVMSDCLFRFKDNLPGCPEPLSGMLKQLYNRKLAINQARLHIGPSTIVTNSSQS